jgi:hypothetical protein
MRSLSIVTACVLSLVLAGSVEAAGKKGQKKKAGKPINGTVTEVKKDALVVKAVEKKGSEPVEKTISITDSTRYEKVAGKKIGKGTAAGEGKRDDVKAGSQVSIVLKDGKAESVKFLVAKKKKKTK